MVTVSRWMPALSALAAMGLISGCGSAQFSSSTHATVNIAAPLISQEPQNTTADEGGSASFTVVAIGSAPLTYQWMQNNAPVPGGTGSTLRIAAVAFADSGAQLSVIVRNNVGSVTSNSATLTVTPVAPSIVVQPQHQSVVVGSAAIFVVEATGSDPLIYQWIKNGTAIAGATSASYLTPPETVTDSGSLFKVTISNAEGAVTSTAARLTVTPFGISLVAGHLGGFGTIDGTAGGARFFNPKSIAADTAGNIYVADSTRDLIRKVSPTGVVTTIAGAAGIGGATDGPGRTALFNQPGGVAVDPAGDVYVADTGNDTIRKISAAGQVSTVAGTPLMPGSLNGPGTTALFNAPEGITIDSAGNLYVADSGNNTIRKITSAGVVTTLAGTPGTAGAQDGTGAAARFNGPLDLTADAAGTLYVADTFNNTIRTVTPTGVVTTLAGTAGAFGNQDGPAATALFGRCYGITIDPAGNLYVSDVGNESVRKITPQLIVSTLAGSGAGGYADGTGNAAQFSTPWGVAVDAAGNIYSADYGSGTIRKITPANAVTTLAGTAPHPGSEDGTGAAAWFNSPSSVATDPSGNLYIADASNNTIRKITWDGVVTTLAGTAGAAGATNGTGAVARFNIPTGIVVDAGGNAYVADAGNNSIRKITAAGAVTTLAGTPGATGFVDGPGSAALFNEPTGLAIDTAGNLYVTDTGNYTVRQITPAGFVTTLAGSAGVTGSTDGNGSAALFNSPQAIAADSAGILYVADTANETIREILPSGAVTTLAGTAGKRGTNDGTAATASFYHPSAIVVDGLGNVYVADTPSQTIRKITASGVVTTIAGAPRSEGVTLGALPGSLNQPSGLALLAGPGTSLIVADFAENSILRVTLN
jgi:sugar lactone lactonase YvrE